MGSVSVAQAAQLLNSGQVVAVPTETVYGLAASLSYPEAIAQIFIKKKRPAQNPLIIHLAELNHLKKFVVEYSSLKLLQCFWPGPLTVVLPIFLETVPAIARANLPTAAFRIPNHPLALQLLHLTGPLVMPSANLSGRPSATCSQHIRTDFGDSLPILEAGRAPCGLESTVIKEQEGVWQIIRLGAIPPCSFAPLLGYIPEVIQAKSHETAICPGQLYRHYAPQAILQPTQIFDDNMKGFVVGFSDRRYPKNCSVVEMGFLHDPETVAENLYSALRRLDDLKVVKAWIDMRFPSEGLWITIAERLYKASQQNEN